MRGRSPIMTTRLPKHTGICARIQCRQVFCKFQQVLGKCRDWVTQQPSTRVSSLPGSAGPHAASVPGAAHARSIGRQPRQTRDSGAWLLGYPRICRRMQRSTQADSIKMERARGIGWICPDQGQDGMCESDWRVCQGEACLQTRRQAGVVACNAPCM